MTFVPKMSSAVLYPRMQTPQLHGTGQKCDSWLVTNACLSAGAAQRVSLHRAVAGGELSVGGTAGILFHGPRPVQAPGGLAVAAGP